MKYTFNYQIIRRGEERPVKGDTVQLREDEKTGQHLIPNVGDYVQVQKHFGDKTPLMGRVKTRLFNYSNAIYPDRNTCHINIVLEEPEEDVRERLSSNE
ncbi:hypothetical protein [Modicisalibacter xianhensis]|uniref:Uncharacterized protein n=1 Tax=Modicisalibacter xianhensis TaxID=442341 RepID=A0A1I3C8B6_9GAMM|nr:hypothetical protein [Halomonas xianhensis]SFH70653.1 hypothetical protein SAMN04487959_10859 [Halomonas xianhensis]